jgi:hypothetical protein
LAASPSRFRFSEEERAEIAALFRAKLAQLRAHEEPPRGKRALRPRRPTIRLPEQQPSDDAVLSSGETVALLGSLRP